MKSFRLIVSVIVESDISLGLFKEPGPSKIRYSIVIFFKATPPSVKAVGLIVFVCINLVFLNYGTYRKTESYFFNDPERHVPNKVIYGFGPYGLESRLIGPTTDMFIAAVQGAISDEVAYLLDRNLVPDDGILATLY